jgi:hypothetical protein
MTTKTRARAAVQRNAFLHDFSGQRGAAVEQ